LRPVFRILLDMCITDFLHHIIDFFCYNECPSCGKTVLSSPSILCPDCTISVDASFMFRMKKPEYSDRFVFWDEQIELYPFHVVRNLIYSGKYGKKDTILRISSEYFIRWISTLDEHIDYISCIPMGVRKRIKKGENHSRLIGKHISGKTGIPFLPLLKNHGSGRDQKLMTREMRFLNTIGRFRFGYRNICGKTILLVDDVMTTGSTMNECSRILKKNGAQKVIILTIASVESKKLEKIG